MNKKLISLFSFLVLAVSGLSGCDKPVEDDGSFSIELGKHQMDLVIGTSQRLNYDFLPDIPDNTDITWTTSDPNIASVTSSGYVTGVNYGECVITATMDENGKSDSCTVTVSDPIDYVSQLKLNMHSPSKKAEVTTYLHIDGDTTHFSIDSSYGYQPSFETGILKARYLGVDTPESTGKIEAWGKKASKFTKDIVTNAHKIIIESNDENWNVDSTGGRALVFVWYQMNEGDDYRCLNLELLQEGLANQKDTLGTKYGEICYAAFSQAQAMEKYIHGTELDPDFFYGDYTYTTLKDIRTHLNYYLNSKVTFDATVVYVKDQTVYLEDYDEETDITYGMQLFLGYKGNINSMIYPNYRIRVAGSLQYYEAGGTYQIADPVYSPFADENSIDSCYLIATSDENLDKRAKYDSITIPEIQSTKTLNITEFVQDEGTDDLIEVTHDKDFALGGLMVCASAELENLVVTSSYTTATGDSKGSISLTCKDSYNNSITVRTEVLYDGSGEVVLASYFTNKTFSVKGVIDYYDGSYQLRVFTLDAFMFD